MNQKPTKFIVGITNLMIIIALGLMNFACQTNDHQAGKLSNQTNSTSGNSNSNAVLEKQIYQAVGIVKTVDRAAARITIDHEDIKGYMSAMEMNESVSDPKLLKELKTGDQIDFEIERTGEKLVITEITKRARQQRPQ